MSMSIAHAKVQLLASRPNGGNKPHTEEDLSNRCGIQGSTFLLDLHLAGGRPHQHTVEVSGMASQFQGKLQQ